MNTNPNIQLSLPEGQFIHLIHILAERLDQSDRHEGDVIFMLQETLRAYLTVIEQEYTEWERRIAEEDGANSDSLGEYEKQMSDRSDELEEEAKQRSGLPF